MGKPAFRILVAVCALAGFAVAHANTPPPWLTVAHELAPAGTDFTPHGTQPGLFSALLSADYCGQCHAPAGNSPPSASTYLPYPAWAGSMMANATRDPMFWAALDVANHDTPGAGDFCLRCHTPAGWYEGHVVKTAFNLPPANDPVQGAAGCLLKGNYGAHDDSNSDFGGVTCHFCHRLLDHGPNNEPPFTGNADAWVDDHACSNGSGSEPCRAGPYDYASGDTPPPHAWIYSAYLTQSEVCAVCHNVSTPDTASGPLVTLKLNDGTDTGHAFPLQRTYAEWEQSGYPASGPTCQSCHMPVSEDPNATACTLDGYPNRTGNLPVHEFVGGNTWMPGVIKGEYDAAIVASGGTDRAASYDQTVQWAREMLGNAASLAPSIVDYTPPGASAGSIDLSVVVTNQSGHKLPTGYAEGRRMWLNVRVTDANGGIVAESAPYDADTGVLTTDAQARVYETQQGIWNQQATGQCDVVDAGGAAMFHSVLNDCIAKDTRIPPLGFRPATTDDPDGYDTRPVGADYPETSPGSGVLVNFDTANYAFDIPVGTVQPLTITTRLYYQTTSGDYMAFLRDQATQNAFQGENDLCAGAPGRPFAVGPGNQTRGGFMYALWSGPAGADRIFADGFDGTSTPLGYGRSPPELMQVASIGTSP